LSASYVPVHFIASCYAWENSLLVYALNTTTTLFIGEGEEKSGADCQVKIKLIAPPMYVMTCMTLDKEQGLETMNHCIETIASVIRAKG